MKRVVLSTLILLIASCGGKLGQPPLQNGNGPQPVPWEDNAVVHARATIVVVTAGSDSGLAVIQNQPINVTSAPSTTFTIDNSKFSVPPISNTVLDFGKLTVNALSDNNLAVCGTGGNQPCGNAILRVYTTGVAGAGLWNAAGGYGAPITSLLTAPGLTVGLNASGAAVMQTVPIPSTKHVVHLADFTPAPSYDFKIDFSNAGAGSYGTTLVVEYALTP